MDYATSNIDSANYKDIDSSIAHARNNPIVLDNLGTYYLFEGEMLFSLNFLKKYENIFKNNLRIYKINKDHFYRPEYVSYELYNTTDLWYLLLFVNDMASPMDFTKEVINIFDMEMIEVLNNLLREENKLLDSHKEPIPLTKHYLKYLSEPSLNVFPTSLNDTIPPTDKVINTDETESLTSKTFTKFTRTIRKNYSLDENNNLRPNGDNGHLNVFLENYICMPSTSVTETYRNKMKVKVYLEAGKNYKLAKMYNGTADFYLSGNGLDRTISLIPSNRSTIHWNEPYMSYDIREANILNNNMHKENWILKNGEYSDASISFIPALGQYVLTYNPNDNYKYTEEPPVMVLPLNEHDNASKLNQNEFIEVTMIYSANFDNNNYDFAPFNIYVEYTDESTATYELDEKFKSVFNTNGQFGIIKRMIPNLKKNIKTISISLKENKLSNGEFMYKFLKCFITGAKSSLILEDLPEITKSGFYDLEYIYLYQPEEEGLYFEPIIYDADTDLNNPVDVKEYQVTNIGYDIDGTKSNIRINKSYNYNANSDQIVDIYPNDFNLSENFILELSISKNAKGMFSLILESFYLDNGFYLNNSADYNHDNISEEDNYIIFNENNGKFILENALYRMISVYNNKFRIIDKCDAIALGGIKLVDIPSDLFNGDELKIVKKGNKIRVYKKKINSDDWDYDNILVSYLDKSTEGLSKGNIKFRAIACKGNITIKRYITQLEQDFLD